MSLARIWCECPLSTPSRPPSQAASSSPSSSSPRSPQASTPPAAGSMSATERPSGLRGFEIRFQCVEPGLSVGRNLAASVDKKRPKAGREGPPEGHRAGPYGNRRARSPRALRGNRRSAIPGDLTFACHETTRQPVVQHCAGALILNEKLGRPNWRIRFAATLGLFDPSRLHLEAPVVDSVEAFVRIASGGSRY